MSNLSQFLGGGGGGGLTPKFQEFTSSGTFTPSQALIDAGGYIEVFLVGGGGNSSSTSYGGSGGETILQQMYLTSVAGISVTIGAGGSHGGSGSSSLFNGSSAGGVNLTAQGGTNTSEQINRLGSGWGAEGSGHSAGNGLFGYGAGGTYGYDGGIFSPKANSGQGAGYFYNGSAASGYCLVKWYE